MLILNCAACNKALPYNAKRCAACKVRYCSKECQAEDWQNGHKKMCKKIARHGGVEKFEADVEGAKFMIVAPRVRARPRHDLKMSETLRELPLPLRRGFARRRGKSDDDPRGRRADGGPAGVL